MRLQQAIRDLLDTKPFYAHFLLNSRLVMDYAKVTTAGVTVTKSGPLFVFNTEFIESLTVGEVKGVIEHEILHLLFEHTSVMGKDQSDPSLINSHELRNFAMDCSINQFIDVLPKDCVTLDSFRKILKDNSIEAEQTWEYYYDKIKQKAPKQMVDSFDVHGIDHPEKSTNQKLNGSVIKATLDKAVKASNGNLPEQVIKQLDAFNDESKLPWQSILANFVARATSSTTLNTRKKRNRRFGVSVPGKKKKRELTLGVCVDSSGSISDDSYTAFLAEVNRIAKDCKKLYLVDADCEVQNVDVVKKGQKVNAVRHGNGGTAYSPAINKCKELSVDAIIYFGDFDSSDTPTNPKVPFLWVGVGNQEPPGDFGEVIRL